MRLTGGVEVLQRSSRPQEVQQHLFSAATIVGGGIEAGHLDARQRMRRETHKPAQVLKHRPLRASNATAFTATVPAGPQCEPLNEPLWYVFIDTCKIQTL